MARDSILQVKTSFNATIAGQPVLFREGDLVDADHLAVKTWPQYFGELAVVHRAAPQPVVEQATARPGEKRGR